MSGGTLFTQDFLMDGVRAVPAYAAWTDERLAAFRARLAEILAGAGDLDSLNEAQTEQRVIRPLLDLLDFGGLYDVQANLEPTGRATVPDYLLYRNADDFAAAEAADLAREKRILHAAAVMDAKAWDVGLDKRGKGSTSGETPSAQILRYLSRAESLSDRRVRWGILTSGQVWRLYFQGAKSRIEEYYEADLPALLAPPPGDADGDHALRLFALIFSRQAFEDGDDGRSFHRLALDEGRLWEERVRAELSDAVFGEVYPRLIAALAAADPAARPTDDDGYLAALREAALTLLYRLLFALYAEDRDLLPRRSRDYDDYGLSPWRDGIGERIDAGDRFSAKQSRLYCVCLQLFGCIDRGDDSIGVPPYNGGLFRPDRAPLLERARLPDAAFAPLFDLLSRTNKGDRRVRINYRDLSVRELGAIYERLLEFAPVADASGPDGLIIRATPFARKGSGSYYTPEDLVRLTIRRTLEPLIEERRAAFRDKAEELAHDRRPVAERLAALRALDPALRILDLKVVDPAMGSGHFLVSLIDYLAEQAYAAIGEAAEIAHWADYRSPLPDELDRMRAGIRDRAAARGWTLGRDQLDDRNLVKRMALKRCVYGVDKNPMAVELAKVALWLHTFTVGAPLSFLDHHLRCGDSLFGEWVRAAMDALAAKGALFINESVQRAKAAAAGMARIEALSDAELDEVKESEAEFARVDEFTRPLIGFLSFIHALRWLEPLSLDDRKAADALLFGQFGDPVRVAARLATPRARGEGEADRRDLDALNGLLHRAWALIDEQRFFHWEAAFPGVWRDWESAAPQGGFDAVIGNPPWDRMKMQEVEWFANRAPDIARQERAADRKAAVAARRKAGDPLAAQYDVAAERAETAMRVARTCGEYPLLSKGDVNLYSLFVERAQRLVSPRGLAGLVTPSGIAADKGAAEFFRSVTDSGRLAVLFDFENRGSSAREEPFFPDVDSRFKFSVSIIGGARRTFAFTICAFYQHSTDNAERAAFPLEPADFALLNPNTRTAPVFRHRRDALLTLALYRRLPVWVDRRVEPPLKSWPVDYATILHMTNDSGLFRTSRELEQAGAYRVADDGFWRKGAQRWLPLYEGKMVQAFDHRAASVRVNPANLHRPAQPLPATLEQSASPRWTPEPQYWVEADKVAYPDGLKFVLGFKDVTAPTNVRTMIAALLPPYPAGNTLPLLAPSRRPAPTGDDDAAKTAWRAAVANDIEIYHRLAPLLAANLNAFVYDFMARQKVQGQHLNAYIVEQLPLVPIHAYARAIGDRTAEEIIREHVLRLSFVAEDMRPYAETQGYLGDPFIWDEEERLHLRARLDALYFLLCDCSRDEAAYMLDAFPIVAREEREKHRGRFRSRNLILAYMSALAAGDAEVKVAG